MVGWDVCCYDMEKTHSMEQLPNNSMPRLGQALPQDEEADQKVWGEINPEAQDQTWGSQIFWIERASCHRAPWSLTIANPECF